MALPGGVQGSDIEHADGLAKPVVVCDDCGKEIADADHGNYQWEMDGKCRPVNGVVYFTHKWCWHPFEESKRDKRWGVEGLLCLLPSWPGT